MNDSGIDPLVRKLYSVREALVFHDVLLTMDLVKLFSGCIELYLRQTVYPKVNFCLANINKSDRFTLVCHSPAAYNYSYFNSMLRCSAIWCEKKVFCKL